MGKMETLTHVKSKPLKRLAHNLSGLITSTRGVFVPNLVKIRSRGTSGQHGEIPFCVTFYFFPGTNVEKTPGRILTRNGSKDAKSRKDVPFGGYKMKNWNLTTIYPQKPKNLAMNRQFPAKMMKHETPSISESRKPRRWKFNTMLET